MNTKLYWFSAILISTVIFLDIIHAWRNKDKKTTTKAAILGITFYISIAILFGIYLGGQVVRENQAAYFAAWITEYSLSLDNLFVFVLIFKRLKIPQERQEIALLFGIIVSLVLRGICLFAGINLVSRFNFLNLFFAAFLIYTSFQMFKDDQDEEWQEYRVINWLKSKNISIFGITLLSIALADLMFAFDSIPAVIGITNNFFLILTANFMALMGLRQLYFLIEILIKKLQFLYIGISLVLLFIGIKLLFATLNETVLNNSSNKKLPEVTTVQSLLIIILLITMSALFSIIRKQKPRFPF